MSQLLGSIGIWLLLHAPSDRLLQGTAWVVTDNGRGTGWLVSAVPPRLITNRHVVGSARHVEVFFPWYRDGDLERERDPYFAERPRLRHEGLCVIGKVGKLGDDVDLAVIDLPSLPKSVRPLPVADHSPSPGRAVRTLGNREDAPFLWLLTHGTVRATGRLQDGYFAAGRRLSANLPLLLLSNPIDVGDSGSPVFNELGQVVGVIAAVRRGLPSVALAVSLESLRAFLDLPPPSAELPPKHIASALRATVWCRPTADARTAGVLLDRERRLILTTLDGAGSIDRVPIQWPIFLGNHLLHERSHYPEGLTAYLATNRTSARVIARDPHRDVALLEVESIPETADALPFGPEQVPIDREVFAISHPPSLDLLWLTGHGRITATGRTAVAATLVNEPRRVGVHLAQLPQQAKAAGGPVVDSSGRLVGLVLRRELPDRQTAHLLRIDEIRAFLAETRPGYAPASVRERLGLEYLRWKAHPPTADFSPLAHTVTATVRRDLTARCLEGRDASAFRELARIAEADDERESALSLVSRAIELDPQQPAGYVIRARLLHHAKLWRQAKADLDQALELEPTDPAIRLTLLPTLAELRESERLHRETATVFSVLLARRRLP